MAFKGIIEFGCQQGSNFFLEENSFQLAESSGLDGVVIQATANDGTNLSRPLFNGEKVFTLDDCTQDIHNFLTRGTLGWGRLKHNFLRVQISNADWPVDWFHPQAIIYIKNIALIGKLAAEAGLKGIWLDTESYDGKTWTHSKQYQREKYTFPQYQKQVYSLARLLVKEIRRHNLSVSVMTPFAYEYFAEQPPESLPTNEIGLYGAFLDGLHDQWGAEDNLVRKVTKGKIILTTEASYQLFDDYNLSNVLSMVNGTKAQPYKGNSKYFGRVNEFGLSTWVDCPPFNSSWEENFFTPDNFETALKFFVKNCSWGWIYQSHNFLFGNPGDKELPAEYKCKLRALNKNA